MADRIYINTDIYARITDRLTLLSGELADCAASLSRVDTDRDAGGQLRINLGGRLSSTGASMPDGRLDSCVRSLQQIIRGLRSHTNAMASHVREAANLFESVEEALTNLDLTPSRAAVFSEGGASSGMPGLDAWIAQGLADGVLQVLRDEFASLVYGDGFAQLIIGGVPIAMLIGGGVLPPSLISLIAPAMGGIGELGPIAGLEALTGIDIGIGSQAEFDFGRYDFDHVSPLADRIGLATISATVGESASIWSTSGTMAVDGASVTGSLDFLKASYEAGVSAGLYAVEVDENGNQVYRLSPGAEAHIGASIALFEASASGMYEIIDGVTAHSSITATVGEVSADAEAKIGIVDGELNLYAGAELEAIAGEIRGDIGIDIAGVDTTVSASLNYGIGVHAEAGLNDGVLTVDVGASLGVGGSIAIEIDIGGAIDGMVDAVSGFAESVWNWF